jgi:hypothetical protein
MSKVSPTSTQKSPHPSDVFTPKAYSTESDTELEIISGGSEEASSDDDSMPSELHSTLNILESRLSSVLRHDLALAARLIPQIHHQVQSTLALEAITANNDTAAGDNSGTSGSAPALL